MWLDATAKRLFVADWTNARILVFDSTTLDPLPAFSLTAYLPARPQQLAGHEGSGTLFVVVDQGGANAASTVVAIDTVTTQQTALTGLGNDLTIQVDESAGRLFAFGVAVSPPLNATLTAISVATKGVLGTVDVETLMDLGPGALGMERLNPLTGEIPFVQPFADQFVLVDGRTLTGELLVVADSAGIPYYLTGGTWNTRENKLTFTTVGWNGYFIYDRDNGQSSVTSCINDGSEVFFSSATNRVYSGAEIDARPTIIEGSNDACWNGEVGWLSGPAVGFVEAARKAYFVGDSVTVVDEDTRTIVTSEPSCIPPPGSQRPLHDHGVAVDQAARRLYARVWEGDDNHLPIIPGPEADYGCVLVLQEDARVVVYSDGFEGPTDPPGGWTSTQP